jgi:molybdate transport system permease protein
VSTSTHRRLHPAVVAMAAVGTAFVALPLLALLIRAPWGNAAAALADHGAWVALRLSLVVSVSAALVSSAFGFPIAWVLARGRFRGRNLLRAVVILPIVLPPVVGGIALLASLGRGGIVGRWLYDAIGLQLPFTTAGAVVAATFVSIPLFVIAAESGLRGLDPRLEDAAAAAGASRGYVARRITLPLLAPQLAAGAILAWARALGEFGATITFAGSLAGRTQTLPLAVYEARQTDPGAAVLLSLLLVGLSLVVLVLLRDRLWTR